MAKESFMFQQSIGLYIIRMPKPYPSALLQSADVNMEAMVAMTYISDALTIYARYAGAYQKTSRPLAHGYM